MIESRELAWGNIVTGKKLVILRRKASFDCLKKSFENWLESNEQDKMTEENVSLMVFQTFCRQYAGVKFLDGENVSCLSKRPEEIHLTS
jgi:hypothetical protein